METELSALVRKLDETHHLTVREYADLLQNRSPQLQAALAELACRRAQEHYGRSIFVRGLLEVSNICKNGCLYCGINRENRDCQRYRLIPEQIYACAREGYALGFRTVVMQGGEDSWFTDDRLTDIIRTLKEQCPGIAVTLSLGERSSESYQRLFDAGADRYLLRHETADPIHYSTLHPADMSYTRRMGCLEALHRIGYQTGCGFMVGSPGRPWGIWRWTLNTLRRFLRRCAALVPLSPTRIPVSGIREPAAWSLPVFCCPLSGL